MSLSRINILNFRNLSSVEIAPHKNINLFYGNNGSGKTSLLESIYYISFARSFRSRVSSHIVQKDKKKFSIFAEIGPELIGIERCKNGDLRIKRNKEFITSISPLSASLPIQLIYPDSYQLLNDGSKIRRQFIDWGVFHVEHQHFFSAWKKMQKVLKQRNALLKKGFQACRMIHPWDLALEKASKDINPLRENYIKTFEAIFVGISKRLLPNKEIVLKFKPGWDTTRSLREVLSEELDRDLKFGFTKSGPHRADLDIYSGKSLAKHVLSRGEQKMLVCAMSLAQAKILKDQGKTTIFLIDDLPSELDEKKRKAFCDMLLALDSQIFITAIERKMLKGLFDPELMKMFHVKHGMIVEDYV